MEQIFLSRRNLETLLNKLNRKKEGGDTFCAIIKNDNLHPKYPQTMNQCMVTAVEDAEYYAHREAGVMHPLDDPAK